MSTNNPGCLGIILKLFGVNLNKGNGEEIKLPYGLRDDFLSPSELSFYKVLVQALDGRAQAFTKVSLSDIFFVRRPDQNISYKNKIDRKHVDFLICSNDTMKPLAGVELDDTSHNRADRVKRDKFVNEVFKSAELRLIRFENKRTYTLQEIREKVDGIFESSPNVGVNIEAAVNNEENVVPNCPKCGIPMVLRETKKGDRAGEKFYGCVNFPRCREVGKV